MGDVVNLNQHRKRRRQKKDPGRHVRAGLDKATRQRIDRDRADAKADLDGKRLTDPADTPLDEIPPNDIPPEDPLAG